MCLDFDPQSQFLELYSQKNLEISPNKLIEEACEEFQRIKTLSLELMLLKTTKFRKMELFSNGN